MTSKFVAIFLVILKFTHKVYNDRTTIRKVTFRDVFENVTNDITTIRFTTFL